MFTQAYTFLVPAGVGGGVTPVANTVIQSRFEGSNGANSFIDDTGKAIINRGSATISTAQSYFGTSSLRTTGAIGGNVAWAHSTDQWIQGDFTIEFWFYPVTAYTTGSPRTVLTKRDTATGIPPFHFGMQTVGNGLRTGFSTNGSQWLTGASSPPTLSGTSTIDISNVPLNAWTHIAVTRSGSTFRWFKNGIQVGTFSYSGALFNSTQDIGLGGDAAGTNASADAYFDNVRFINGTALYTANFNPGPLPNETAVDPYANNVVLLMHMDPNGNATTGPDFIDVKGHAMTKSGAPVISTAQSVFGGASGSFPNAASGGAIYLSTPDSEDWNFSATDATIEGWVRFPAFPTVAGSGGEKYFFGHYNATNPSWLFTIRSLGELSVYTSAGGAAGTSRAIETVALNTWYHFALVKAGTNIHVFLDGVLKNSFTNQGVGLQNCSAALTIGGYTNASSSAQCFLDEIRITKGVARYTATFTKPTAPFPNN